jgi:hypothetical protein
MSQDIPESDWEVLRQLHPVALERYCQKALKRSRWSQRTRPKARASTLPQIYGVIHERDEMISAVFSGLRRSTGMMQLILMHAQGLVTEEEIGRFTQSTRDAIARVAAERAHHER